MDDYRMQKRYFTVRLKRFRQQPELHRALIEDCEVAVLAAGLPFF